VSSSHGSGDFTIDIRISPPHLAAFQGLMLGQSVPVGTAAVAFHTRGGTAESSYGMQKQPNGWFFVVADSEGRILEQGGLPLCAQCHEEAPADSLFVPSAARLPGPRVADGGP
jgi:hypothetical protein